MKQFKIGTFVKNNQEKGIRTWSTIYPYIVFPLGFFGIAIVVDNSNEEVGLLKVYANGKIHTSIKTSWEEISI